MSESSGESSRTGPATAATRRIEGDVVWVPGPRIIWIEPQRVDRDIYEKHKALGGIVPSDEPHLVRDQRGWEGECIALAALSITILYGTTRARPRWGIHRYMDWFFYSYGVGATVETFRARRRISSCQDPAAVRKALEAMTQEQRQRDRDERNSALEAWRKQTSRRVASDVGTEEATREERMNETRQHAFEEPMERMRQAAMEERARESGPVAERMNATQPAVNDVEDWPAIAAPAPESSAPNDSQSPESYTQPDASEPQSSWDAIRQGYIPARRTRDRSGRPASSPDYPVPPSAAAPDRRTDEQRKFDQLLEKERTFGQKRNGKDIW